MRDNIHYNFRKIDGYNKRYNFIISAREAGKSTAVWLDKAYKSYLEGKTTIVFRRQIVAISDAYIMSIQNILNKFISEDIVLTYTKSEIKDGLVMVYLKENKKAEKRPFIFICALTVQIGRIKSLVVRNIKYGIYDEFIVNPHFGEKYIKDEVTKFREVEKTFFREAEDNYKIYFMGNPYSFYNPYFSWVKVDYSSLKIGTINSGFNWAIELYELSDELKKAILKKNPEYQFDDSYAKYVFSGININDSKIPLYKSTPQDYYLFQLFNIDGEILGIYRNNGEYNPDMEFYCKKVSIKEFSQNRRVYCFTFEDLVSNTTLIGPQDKMKFAIFKQALRENSVKYEQIDIYYKIIDIFNQI